MDDKKKKKKINRKNKWIAICFNSIVQSIIFKENALIGNHFLQFDFSMKNRIGNIIIENCFEIKMSIFFHLILKNSEKCMSFSKRFKDNFLNINNS